MPTTINPSDQTITQYNIQTGGANNLLNNVAPTSTVGIPLISQNATTQPIFGTALVAGGGTGAVTLTGVLTGNGTSAVTASTVTQNGVIVGGASNAVTSTAVGSTGQVLQANTSAPPTYSTATYPSVATGTGTILRADGTNWSPTTATFPSTAGTSGNVLTSNGTNWSSTAPATSGTVTSVSGTTNQVSVATGTTTPVISLVGPYTPATYTAHGVLIGEGTSSIVALGVGATGTVLIGSAGQDPVFSATPSITSITFPTAGGTGTATGDILASYEIGTWVPTIQGATTGGTTTYGAVQNGFYVKIGKMVYITGQVTWTAATGTGIILLGSVPFTISSSANAPNYPAINIAGSVAIATSTMIYGSAGFNTTNISILGLISATGASVNSSLALNTNNTLIFSGFYLASA